MAQPYLDQLQQFIRNVECGDSDLVCKHFFSGAALYANGKICASLTPKGLAFKLSPARCMELIANRVAIPMQYFENAPIKKNYVLFPNPEKLSDGDIIEYLRECIESSAE